MKMSILWWRRRTLSRGQRLLWLCPTVQDRRVVSGGWRVFRHSGRVLRLRLGMAFFACRSDSKVPDVQVELVLHQFTQRVFALGQRLGRTQLEETGRNL